MIDKNLKIEITEVFSSPVSKVWSALTDKEKVKQYFFGTEVITDWEPESEIIFKGEWDGNAYVDKGKILEAQKEKLIKYSYISSFSGLPDLTENYAIITYKLKPVNSGTELKVIQEGFKDEKS
jgi:uncharacterized protein YndB with AHSA1/START domain